MHKRRYKGKKIGREKAQRKALLRSLATSVILYEKVDTTKTKAKEAQREVERLITLAKDGSLSSVRRIDGYLLHKNAGKKLMTELVKVYKDRKGGYTRVVGMGPRVGDNAPMARIELLDTDKILKTEEQKNRKTKEQNDKKTEKPKGKKTEAKKTAKESKKTKKESKEKVRS